MLTFDKLLINYLFTYIIFASAIKFTKTSTKNFCTDNSVYLIVQLDTFYSILNKET